MIAEAANPVKGLAGYRMEFRSTSGAGKTRHGFEVLWRKPGSGYLLTLNAEESAFEEAKARFDALLARFEDLETLGCIDLDRQNHGCSDQDPSVSWLGNDSTLRESALWTVERSFVCRS